MTADRAGMNFLEQFGLGDFDILPFLKYNFDQNGFGDEPPPILYKYLSPSNFEKFVNTRSLRVSQKYVLNDVFEFRGRAKEIIDTKFRDGMKAALRSVFDQLLQRSEFMTAMIKSAAIQVGIFPTPLEMARLSVALLNPQAKAQLSAEFAGLLAGLESAVDVGLEQMAAQFNSPYATEQILNNAGMLCLSEKSLNQPMWAHYAAGGKGAVVGISSSSSRFFRPPADRPPKASPLGRVRYSDEIVDGLFDDIYSIFLNKNSDWSYECEWRAIYQLEDCQCVGVDQSGDNVYTIEFEPQDIKEIFWGYNIDHETVMPSFVSLLSAGVNPRTCFVTAQSVEGLRLEHCVEP